MVKKVHLGQLIQICTRKFCLRQLIGGADEQVKINDLRRRRNEGI